jgi:hypothetical protein
MKLLQQKSKVLFIGLDEPKGASAAPRFEACISCCKAKNRTVPEGIVPNGKKWKFLLPFWFESGME